jgi:hypothetical protein
MILYLTELFNKIYKYFNNKYFKIKNFKSISIQTDKNNILSNNNKIIQTDNPTLYEKSTQTYIKGQDIYDDSEWVKLTWINTSNINILD